MSVLTHFKNNRGVFLKTELRTGLLLIESRFIFSFGAAEGGLI